MRFIRIGLFAGLLASLLGTTAAAQSRRPASGVQSLAHAERTLIDALTRRDRTAFQKLLADDSVFFLPTMSEGPEAIVKAWLPFLIDGGPTMIITSDGVTVSGASRGSSTGTFEVQGSDEGTMIPPGTVAISWRRVAGAWKISALDGSPGGPRLAVRGGLGSYRFGMSREQVARVAECKPYTKVAQTGGLECPYYRFEGHPMNISFLFNAGGLSRIQLGFYEGESEMTAREAVGRAIEYLARVAGRVNVDGLEAGVTPDAIMGMLREQPAPGQIARVDISSHAASAPETWLAQVARHQNGYHVTLLATRR